MPRSGSVHQLGPWESGMVSPELEKQFATWCGHRPTQCGAHEPGPGATLGEKGEVEVLLGGLEAGRLQRRRRPMPCRRRRTGLPLISTGASLSRLADGSVEMIRTLDPAHDVYLNDHRLDGKPVFPMAMALELMAEAAPAAWLARPTRDRNEELRLLRGLVLDNGSQPLRVLAKPLGSPTRDGLEIEVSIAGVAPQAPPHYKAIACMGSRLPSP